MTRFANMVMGRATLLSDGPDDGQFWYDRSTSLSPSFAKGHYSRGIIDVLAGRTGQARDEAGDVRWGSARWTRCLASC